MGIKITNSGKDALWISSPLLKNAVQLAGGASAEIEASSELGVSTKDPALAVETKYGSATEEAAFAPSALQEVNELDELLLAKKK